MWSDKLGIIGCGNMGSAIIRGLIDSGIYSAQSIYVYDVDSDKCEVARGDGCTVVGSVREEG